MFHCSAGLNHKTLTLNKEDNKSYFILRFKNSNYKIVHLYLKLTRKVFGALLIRGGRISQGYRNFFFKKKKKSFY